MRPCRYGRNTRTGRCNKPCRRRRTKVARGSDGQCESRKRARCPPGKERVQFLSHSECLPACEYRNQRTKRCDARPSTEDERDAVDFIGDNGVLRETQTGQKLKYLL